MMSESTMKLLDRWATTTDKQEFIAIGMQLSPDATEEEMGKLYEEAMSGYHVA